MQRIPRGTFLTALGSTLAACSHAGTLPNTIARSSVMSVAESATHNCVLAVKAVVDKFIEDNRKAGRDHVGCVVGLVTPDAPVPTLLFGGRLVSATNHNHAIILNGRTPFEIGSITKTFASTVFLKRRGSYHGVLGDFFGSGLLSPRLAGVPITDLVHYSPGLPQDNHPPIWWSGVIDPSTFESFIQTLAANPFVPNCDPGRSFSYSNFGWGLVGLAGVGVPNAHERVTDEWRSAIAELRAELGLSPSTVPATANIAQVLPAGYNGDQLFPESTSYFRENWTTLFGGGDLVSTGDDMYKWLLFNMGRLHPDVALLRRQQGPTFTWTTRSAPVKSGVQTCVTEEIGHDLVVSAAWAHQTIPNTSVRYLWKDGGVRGFNSWIGFKAWVDTAVPSQFGAFALVNLKSGADFLGPKALHILLNQASAPPPLDLGDSFDV